MARMVFQKILEEGAAKGTLPRASRQATRKFRQKARQTKITPRQVWAEKERHKHYALRRGLLGNMYYFFYEAEGKDSLPFWDAFPLVIPIEITNDGFLGLNFHYLDLRLRAVFMDRLLDLVRKGDGGDRSEQSKQGKLDWRKIEYDKLSQIAKYKYFRPCLKRYKFSNMKSRMIQLSREEWDIALFLPLERFQNSGKGVVWKKSIQRISKGA